MATTTQPISRRRPPEPSGAPAAPPLQNGDHLTAAEFERRFEAMPHLKKAELIEGVVYVASPVTDDHASAHFDLILWLGTYRAATPGLVGSNEGTVRLDPDNRPQPDIHLRILPEYGGRVHVVDRYVEGPPELIAEVAYSSASYDLHEKLHSYRRNEVLEYVVWRVQDDAIDWFRLEAGRYVAIDPDPDGLLKSRVFPGLWLEPSTLIRGDLAAVLRVVQQGLASPEHAAFVEQLRQRMAANQPPTGGEGP